MSEQDTKQSTEVRFDLADQLSEAELESFKEQAEKSGAKNLTEHFLNVTIKNPEKVA